MKIAFASKRDNYGNRYYLIVDSDKKEFSRTSSHWFCEEDFIETTKKKVRELTEEVEEAGYSEVQHMTAEIEF